LPCELFQVDTVVGGDHLGCLLADHDRSGVGVAAGTFGMTLASATRRSATPVTRNRG
jgi:hypothetical protein